jgi:hypothetical protein
MSDDDLGFFLDCHERQSPTEPTAEPPPPAAGDIEDFFPEPATTVAIDTTGEQVDAILQAAPSADRATVETLVASSTKAFVAALLNPQLSKRAVWIRDAILQQGSVTYAQIKQRYAEYRRAKRDLLDAGIPLRTESVNGSDGRTILLKLDPAAFEQQRQGRHPLSANELEELKATTGSLCNRCRSPHHRRGLEADHRVGFEMVGNALHEQEGLDAFQPLCGSCNTKKRHACSQCPNDDPQECRECQWAYPESYTHVATIPERRCELAIHNPALVAAFDQLWPRLQTVAARRNETPGETLIRALLQAQRIMAVSAQK